MRYLLDTNVCIAHMRGTRPYVTAKLRSLVPSDVAVCSIVRSELMFGALGSRDPEKTRATVIAFLAPLASLPFDDEAADAYAGIRATLERAGARIGAYDMQIAAIARVNDLTLVTHNVSEFSRVAGLVLEDWERDGP